MPEDLISTILRKTRSNESADICPKNKKKAGIKNATAKDHRTS